MDKLIFGVVAFYTIMVVLSLIITICYFQKMLRLKRELKDKTSTNIKYLRCKIMISSAGALLIIFSILLILLIILNIK